MSETIPITRRGLLKTGGAGLGSLALLGGTSGTGLASGSSETPRLSTEDNWIVDPKGNEVVLRGVNIDGPLFADYYDNKSATEKIEMATTDGWHSRVIRLACQSHRILGEADGDVEWYAENYIDPAVDKAEEQGVYIIIDWHEVDDWNDPNVQKNLKDFWDVVAPRYADREHVLYEIFNEPRYPGGDSLDTWKDWRDTAQPWVDSIREDAPETPIIVGAPRFTQLTKYADDAPLEGDDLIYAVHLYPIHPTYMDMDAIAEAASNVPVALSEWGYINDEDEPTHMVGTTSGYGQYMREWLTENESISWMTWCFGRQYGPQTHSWDRRDEFDENWNLIGGEDYQGVFMKKFLHDTRHDHQPGSSGETPPMPTAPENLSSSATAESVDLEWDASTHPSSEASDEATANDDQGAWLSHYNVYVDGEKHHEVSEESTTVSGLSPGTEHDFYVSAVDGSGTESRTSNLVITTLPTNDT